MQPVTKQTRGKTRNSQSQTLVECYRQPARTTVFSMVSTDLFRKFLLSFLIWIGMVLSAFAETLPREVIEPYIAPPMSLGEPLNDEGVWQLLNSGGAEAGYVFETEPMAPLPGFSGAAINMLVVLDLEARFLDVQLISHNEPIFVSGLPEKLFFGTGIPAAILIFKKQKTDKNVLFIDASREFKSGKNQNQLTAENIQKVIDTYKARETTDKYSYLASFDEIKENDFNLNIPRYVDTFEEEAEIDLMAVRTERVQLKSELQTLETEMEGYLKELGYGA